MPASDLEVISARSAQIAPQPIPEAADLPDYETLAKPFRPIFQQIAQRSVERDRHHVSPQEELAALLAAGFGAVRLPKRHGGQGASLSQTFRLLVELGEADSNFVQILRSHFGFVEGLFDGLDPAVRRLWSDRIATGTLIGAAASERSEVGNITMALTREGNHWRINGEKYYSTGALYADWINVTVMDGQQLVTIMLPKDAEGMTLIDDWDGFGQRLTASGTTRLENVRVDESHILRRFTPQMLKSNGYVLAYHQQVLLAAIAGIGRATLRDAVTFVQGRTRTFHVPGKTNPREDPLVQRVVGRMSSLAFGLDSIVDSVSATLDDAYASLVSGQPDETVFHKADLASYHAQQVAIDLVLKATSLLFEVGGASALSETKQLDRHWRNARTLASHNPAILRERALGDYRLNGTLPSAPLTRQDPDKK